MKILSLILAAVMLVNLLIVPAHQASANGGDEYDELRAKLYDTITGGDAFDPQDGDIAPRIASIDEQAEGYWSTLDKSPTRTYLWSELGDQLGPDMTSNHVSGSYSRLQTMAVAYSTRGSELYQNAELLSDIIDGMDWMYANRYNTSVPKRGYDNWYDWQISSPLSINNITILLYSHLTAQQISDWHAAVDWQGLELSAGNTGANRVWTCNILITSGIVTKNSAKIALGVSALSPVFQYVKSGEGFYSDGSFLQHTALIPYNGGYGVSLLDNLTKVMAIVAGSSWDFTDPNLNNIYNWIYEMYEPLFYNDSMMAMVNGRNIARVANDNEGITSIGAIGSAVVRLAYSAPDANDASAYKSMVKQWMSEATSPTPYDSLGSIQLVAQTKAIMDDSSIAPRGELVLNKQYPSMARAVHRRPGFAFGISMYSDKIANYELINNENEKGWNTGAGMTYLYNADLAQFQDSFWPTVDSHRLPGTTVVQGSETPPHLKNGSNWVGGTEVDGLYGVTGMHLVEQTSSLSARKSWFMFDDEIVSLGADIESTDAANPVETIVENRKLNEDGSNTLTVDGVEQSSALGWSDSLTDVAWAHLQGNVPGSDVGYYFPGGANLEGLREARTANWNSINHYFTDSVKDPDYFVDQTRNYLSLRFDHGTAPSDGSYAYVLLPGKSASEVESYASASDIEILENSADAQAVRENGLGVTGINFWQDGVKTVAGVTSNKKASVMMRTDDTGSEFSVTDPTMANTGTIELSLDMELGQPVYLDSGISVGQNGDETTLSINVNGAGGQSFKVRFAPLGAPASGPDTPTGLAASEVTDHSITLSWDAVDGAEDYRLYRAEAATGDYVSIRELSPGAVSFTDSGLSSGTNYWYKVAALNALGLSPDSEVLSAWTVPAAPGGLQTEDVSQDAVTLSWQAAEGASGYIVARSESKEGPFTPLNDGMAVTDTVYTDTTIVSGINYYYQVAAKNAGGLSAPSASVPSLFGLPAYLIEESFDSMNEGDLGGQNGWMSNNAGVTVNTVTVEAADASEGGKQVRIATASTEGAAEAYALFQAPQGSMVTAEATMTTFNNNWKNALILADSSMSSNSSAVHIVMQNGKIWGYNGGSKTDILTSAPNGVPYQLKVIVNTSTRKFDVYVNGQLLGSQWNYRYSGVGTVDKFSSSIGGNASTTTMDDVRVSYTLIAPLNVQANLQSDTSANVTWDAVPGAAEYRVYRASGDSGGYVWISPSGYDGLSYTDADLETDTTYDYKIVAVHNQAISPESPVVSVTTPAGSDGGETDPEHLPTASLAGPASGVIGQTVDLSVGISQTAVSGAAIVEAIVQYDPSKLEFASADNGEGQLELAAGAVTLLQSGFQLLASGIKPEDGELMLMLARTSEEDIAEGGLLELHGAVKADAAAGSAAVQIASLHVSSGGELLEADTSNASIDIDVRLADASALEAAIDAAEALLAGAAPGSQPGQYPAGAIAAFEGAIAAATSAAQDGSLRQADIDAALAALQAARATFQSSVIPLPATDKSALSAALQNAVAKLDAAVAGDKIGQYPEAAINALESAVQMAEAVMNSGAVSQADIDNARTALNDAVSEFKAKIITLIPGQTSVTIRDLSLIASYYETTADDADWSNVEKADLFGNGEITIVELAAVARMIVADWLAE